MYNKTIVLKPYKGEKFQNVQLYYYINNWKIIQHFEFLFKLFHIGVKEQIHEN